MATDRDTIQKEDAALVAAALLHPEEFGKVIEKYQEPLRRYIRRVARPSKDDVEMILQDVFIKAYENLNDFDQSLQFSSWVYRIAHNESVDYLRKKKREGGSLDEPSGGGSGDDDTLTLAETIAAEGDIAADADRQYVKRSIQAVLDGMPAKYRSVLVLKFLEDKDYAEISDILKKPPGTVATLIHRAKREFRKLAQEKGMHLGDI
jgi:RNA polymerase sigma-70 factor (ECF subfamily)